MKLSLCMIARDEERDLPRCLESVQGAVDEIVVVDTGSADRTPEVAASLGARVVHFPWTGSFAEARNASISLAAGDWILWLDADEELCREDAPALREAVERGECEAYLLHVLSYVGRSAEEGNAVVGLSPRLFRRRPEYAFVGAIHEQILGPIRAVRPDARVEVLPVRVYHYGYLEDRVRRRGKSGRNLAILEEEVRARPDDPYVRFNLGLERVRMGEYEAAAEEFRRAYLLRPDPESAYAPHLLKNLAICLKQSGRHEEALRVVSDALAVLPDFTDLEFVRGTVHWETGDYQAAVLSFLRCVEMGDAPPRYVSQRGLGSHHAWAALGAIFEAVEDREKAVQAYTKALQSDPRHAAALRGMAGLLLGSDPPERVVEFCGRISDLSRDSVRAALADALCSAGHAEAALELTGSGGGEGTAAVRGKALMLLGRYGEAGRVFRELAAAGENRTAGAFHAAACALLGGDPEGVEAGAALLGGLGEWEASWVWRSLGRLVRGEGVPAPEGDRTRALEAALQALGLLLTVGEFDVFAAALPVLEPLLSEGGRHRELGKLYAAHGFLEQAVEELSAAHRLGALDGAGYRALGAVAAARGMWEEAAALYAKAVELDPNVLPSYTSLARALVHLGRYEEALSVLEDGCTRFPSSRLLDDARVAVAGLLQSGERDRIAMH